MKWHGKQLRGVTQWEVWHPEGSDHGLRPQRYGSRREAVGSSCLGPARQDRLRPVRSRVHSDNDPAACDAD